MGTTTPWRVTGSRLGANPGSPNSGDVPRAARSQRLAKEARPTGTHDQRSAALQKDRPGPRARATRVGCPAKEKPRHTAALQRERFSQLRDSSKPGSRHDPGTRVMKDLGAGRRQPSPQTRDSRPPHRRCLPRGGAAWPTQLSLRALTSQACNWTLHHNNLETAR